MLSKRFFEALKATDKPYHQIAWEAGLSPNQLYKITSGVDRPGPGDPRVIAICKYLDFPVDEVWD